MEGKEESRDHPTTKPPSFLNRSLTIHSSASPFSKKPYVPSDGNAAPMKRWYNPFDSASSSFKGKVRHLRTLFETPTSRSFNSSSPTQSPSSSSLSSSPSHSHSHQSINSRSRPPRSFSTDLRDSWSILDASPIRFPGTEDRVVLYFTSLRGIRRTFEDCYTVRIIFRGYRVFVDERDISMDAAYRKELQGLLGEKNVGLPQVFIKGRYIGGVEVVRHLNETGELRKLLQTLPIRDRRFVCNTCGDVRFVPCWNCSGSRKVFDEDEGAVRRCADCNENGLIRCPECCL